MPTLRASGLGINSAQVHTPQIPQEIMNSIVEQLGVPNNIKHGLATQDAIALRPLLCSLRLVSKSLNEAASRLLFRCMVSESGPTHSLFLRTLIKNPRLAKHVRVYHTPRDDVRTGHVYRYIRTCLPLMTGLKELAYRRLSRQGGGLKPLPRHLPKLKTRKKPFQLKKFVWFAEQTRDEEDVQALEFLATQKDLNYLRWVSTRSLPSIYKDTIPHNIHFLDASVDVLVSILPERHSIKGIRLRMYNRSILSHLNFADVRNLAKELFRMDEFHNLSFISVVGDYEPLTLQYLSTTRKSFPNLAVLALDDIDFLRVVRLDSSFPALKEVYFTKIVPREQLHPTSKKVDHLFKANWKIDHVNTREAASLPMGWHRFNEWTRAPPPPPTRVLVRDTTLPLPTSRAWEMSTEYMYSKLLYVDSMRGLDRLWDASPF